MSFYVSCSTHVANTGVKDLCQDLGPIAGYMLCPYDYSITEANARLKATWDTAILAEKANRVYPFPPALGMTDNSEGTVYQDFALGRLFVKDGKTILQFSHQSSRYKHEALKSHTGRKCSVVFFDQQGRIHGVVGSTASMFKAVNLSELTVEKIKMNDGSSQGTHTVVSMTFENPNEWETKPAVISGLPWEPSTLTGLIDVELSLVGTATTSGMVVKAVGARSGYPFNGVVGDFEVRNSAGVIQSLTSVTADQGVHTITATLLAGAYTVALKAPSQMTTKGYESIAPISVTVS